MGLRAELVDDPGLYTEHVEVPDIPDFRLCGQEICDYEPRHPRGIQTSFDL